MIDKKFLFKPGEGLAYSSVGYIILGMILAQHDGADTWADYN